MDAEAELTTGPCLICKQTGRPASVEHVIPAGLGRHADVTLPLGAVCQPCNNELGRQVDEALVHLFEIRFIRGLWRVPDRNGRVVTEIPLRNGRVMFPEPGELHVELMGGEAPQGPDDAGNLIVKAVNKRRKSGDQWRRAVRAVMKIGLSLAYYEHGADYALGREWDATRAAILGEPYRGWAMQGPFDIYRPPDLQAQLLFTVPGAPAVARLQFGGAEILASMSPGPISSVTRGWAAERGLRVSEIRPHVKH